MNYLKIISRPCLEKKIIKTVKHGGQNYEFILKIIRF